MLKPSRKRDVNQLAHQIVSIATGAIMEPAKNSVMAEMGSRGGKVGGKRRAQNMSPAARSEAASRAAKTRWGIEQNHEPSDSAKSLTALLEKNMDQMGLSEAEKKQKFDEMIAYIKNRSSALKDVLATA